MSTYNVPLQKAVKHFWKTRTAVTGGKQMDGFVELVRDLLIEAGLTEDSIHHNRRLELPGYFRAEKKWDLLVVVDGVLLAVIEFKSQVGPSFGNNFNNRTEEALGSATDIWTAFREGAFRTSQRPWLGYLMLLEECPASVSPVAVREPHFAVFPEFQDASYCRRYELLLTHCVRERMYDSACFLMSESSKGIRGAFREPTPELAFDQFAASLLGRVFTYLKTTER